MPAMEHAIRWIIARVENATAMIRQYAT